MKPKRSNKGGRLDQCQTPAYGVKPLLPFLNPDWVIWEPAAGEGFLVEALRTQNRVITSDILTGQDFFSYSPVESWDVLVTNPPFSIKYKWLKRCYALEKPFALLLPVETLGAKTAQRLFRNDPLFELIFMDDRIHFKMPNKGWEGSSAQFPVVWITRGLKIGRQMTFAEIDPPSTVQLSMFNEAICR